jgi:tellurite methyltransferase
MKRPITGFSTDEDGDWVVILSCGHPQHVRHRPPFINRPWVITKQGRQSKLGQTLDCVRCDRFELPNHFIPYQQTPVFTDQSMPAGLKKDHLTKAGIWAKIVVVEGKLRYCIAPLDVKMELSEDRPGIVVPEVPHLVEPMGPVQFFLVFYRSPDCAA